MGGEAVTKSAPKRALFSAFTPELILPLAKGLHELDWEIWGSDSTSKFLNSPTDKDGREKPVVPSLTTHEHVLFDLVAVQPSPSMADADDPLLKNESMLLDAPALLHSAAKNRKWVIPLHISPKSLDGAMVLAEIQRHGDVSQVIRNQLAVKALMATAAMDLDMVSLLRGTKNDTLAKYLVFMQNGVSATYGENQHQGIAIMDLVLPEGALINPWPMELLKGSSLSYNNYLDLDYAISGVIDVSGMSQEGVTAFTMKHAISCGAAWAPTLEEAIAQSFSTDIVAKYGCTLALSTPAGMSLIEATKGTMVDALAGPDFTPELIARMNEKNAEGKPKRKAKVIKVTLPEADAKRWEARSATGRLLVQEVNQRQLLRQEFKTVTKTEPTDEQRRSMDFAWRVSRHARSNAIVLARGMQTVGVGSGQTNRVAAVRNAVAVADHTHLQESRDVDNKLKAEIEAQLKLGPRARGSVLASDAYFPRPDGIELAGKAGVAAIIQPGGSIHDKEAIAMADQYGIAMVFTGWRVFRH